MTLLNIIFYSFAGLLVLLALVVVLSKNVFHSAIALTGGLGVVAALFALLGADFLAASQLLIYVGGVMIIMLFVVMFSQQPREAMQRQINHQWSAAGLLAIAIGAVLCGRFARAYASVAGYGSQVPTSRSIGRLLLGEMVVPFEVVSLVLLAALVGAVIFAQEQKGDSWQ